MISFIDFVLNRLYFTGIKRIVKVGDLTQGTANRIFRSDFDMLLTFLV